MKIYKTTKGILIEENNSFFSVNSSWDTWINNDNLYQDSLTLIKNANQILDAEELISKDLLPPIGNQEVWASGVTYKRSRNARMEESKEAGGGDFYDRVYMADRPELFFKSAPQRVVGSGQSVKIRKDSKWNVPEPELTLLISSSAKIIGYTIGNDMSSRDIEGENPLYLPQAKSYDKAAAIGPCIYVPETPLSVDTVIKMIINRDGAEVFSGQIAIDQINRKLTDLVEYLYREMSFQDGCFLMTGTGIIPPNDFTLNHGDEIRISIDPIGTLVNIVE
jgi:2-dehydro-3-deoxy-D-arabinonate dehydratase